MSTATRGRALEHTVRKLFEADGWSVIRGAASKGRFDSPQGVIKPDLIASKRGTGNEYTVQIIALQCKVEGL